MSSSNTDHHHPVGHEHIPAGRGHSPTKGTGRSDPGQVEYTCPMHPQVRQMGPGHCPICGMALEPVLATAATGESPELRDMSRRFRVATALTVPVFALEMGGHLFDIHHLIAQQASNWIQLLLATPVVLWAGWPFFVRAAASVKNRSLNMFSLIALGTGAAWLYSIVGTVAPRVFPGRDARADSTSRAEAEADPAVERTREQVKMLDDLYKNAVVSITKRYVRSQDKQPAIMVAQDVFSAMKKQGWHSAKLVDATGEPLNDDNAPQTEFEKEAARQINSGKPYFERVVGEGKERRLLAATVVPVVMQKCADCHSHKKVGEVLGFIRYDVPIK